MKRTIAGTGEFLEIEEGPKRPWKEVKEVIDKERKRIWFKAPDEIHKVMQGYTRGPHGQYFTTLVFLLGMVKDLGAEETQKVLFKADDKRYTLDMLKDLVVDWSVLMWFIKYCGLETPWMLYKDVLNSFDTITTKEEFKELMIAFKHYLGKYHLWYQHYFPWNVGIHQVFKKQASFVPP
jgi:hypothetical protein